ncbi:MAG: entericidin A/B family lipoprotein [Polaromonas sp.]|nr:entericidin A/B family lipoprotein [Polaromonas sp.]
MKKTTTLLAMSLAALAFVLAGCNTTKGFGQDLQKIGEKIEEKAKK